MKVNDQLTILYRRKVREASKMSLNVVVITLAAFFLVVPQAMAQKWQSQLPKKPEKELTFYDYRQAFEEYYKQHPPDFKKEKLLPTFEFEGAQEAEDRVALEEHKLFKRWEWLTEPRVYPSGKWDFEKIDAIRERLEAEDNRLVLEQAEINPLKLTIEKGKIIWP